MSRRVWGWWALLLGVAILMGGAALLYREMLPQSREAISVPCPDITRGCALPESKLRIQFDRLPRPMQPFQVEVEIAEARAVHARFTMRGMPMGENRFGLLPAGPGVWKGRITLPVCISGRSDWEMLLEIDGKQYRIPFTAG